MNQIELQYKRETGNSADLCGIESELMTNEFDGIFCLDLDKKAIIDYLASCAEHWAIKMSDIPEEFNDADNLILPDPGYIKWLEEKVELYNKNVKNERN
jgi:hypothetical protein